MITIKFVGLLIVTQLTTNGAQVVMGHIPGLEPFHNAIIAYIDGSRVGGTWSEAGSFTTAGGDKYFYVNVDRENVTFSGPNDAFNNAIREIPHLSCCCPEMKGILPEYGNKDQGAATKASAHFMLANGVYTTVKESTDAVSTLLVLPNSANVQLTIEGQIPGTTTKRTIVLKPGARVIVANTPIDALEGKPVPDSHNDFQAFYNTGVTSAACRRMPGDLLPNPCIPRLDSCPPTAKKVSAAKLSPELRKLIERAIESSRVAMITDVNCSSSQWP